MKYKKYYRIEFEFLSPLSIGNGDNQMSDKDLLLDDRGIPYIPGSSLAGVYRALFNEKTRDRYFGRELTKNRIRESGEKCSYRQRRHRL